MSAKTNISVKVELDMKMKIEYIAKNESMSYADMVRNILYDGIRRFEKENGKITDENLNQLKLFKEQ